MRQFSLMQLFLGVAVFGLFVGSLRYAGPWNSRAIFDAVLLLLVPSIVLARSARAPPRAFWFGFALFGWVMLGLTHFHVFLSAPAPQGTGFPTDWAFHPLAQDNLRTRTAARGLYRLVRPALEIPAPGPLKNEYY